MTVLKLDYDSPQSRTGAHRRILWVMNKLELTPERILCRTTVHGFHVKVELKQSMTDGDVVLLQALMGSDYMRETFNTRRILNGVKHWNVLHDKDTPWEEWPLEEAEPG